MEKSMLHITVGDLMTAGVAIVIRQGGDTLWRIEIRDSTLDGGTRLERLSPPRTFSSLTRAITWLDHEHCHTFTVAGRPGRLRHHGGNTSATPDDRLVMEPGDEDGAAQPEPGAPAVQPEAAHSDAAVAAFLGD